MRQHTIYYFVLTLLGLCIPTAAGAFEETAFAGSPLLQQEQSSGESAPDSPSPSRNIGQLPETAGSPAFVAPETLPPSAWADSESPLNLRTEEQIGSITPPPGKPVFANDTDDLWQRIREGFTLADLDSPLVKEHEAWYANRPDYVRRMVERSQRYLFHIVEEVEKRGMPTEIALLPMIESAYNPKAYSTSHASGIWQFIPSTGKHFGLDQNLLYDGRRDILAATDAALDYLQKLYNMFGSWELALAAYNWGEGSVSRAIARSQANGEPTGYLSLRMPPETRNYVPKLIAIKNIVMDPAAYGLTLNAIPNSPYFATVKLRQHMDVAVAARLAEVPLDEFMALNPAYNKPLVAGVGKPTLLLPVDKVNSFSLNLKNNERPLSSWQTYTPRRGEKLAAIARRFGISLAHLKEINSITGRKKLVAAQTLLVPVTKSDNAPTLLAHIPEPEAAGESAVPGRKTTHTVARGDTVPNIAKRYGMSVAELKSRNNLKSNHLARGQKLTVLAAKSEKTPITQARTPSGKTGKEKTLVVAKKSAESGKHSHYVVKRGDTVFSIARRFNVAVNDLQRWNRIPADYSLQPGNKLTVYSPKG